MSFQYILIPGRHHAVTRYQIIHAKELLARDDVDSRAQLVWAITSANHSGTRRNPLSGSRRLGMIEAVAVHERIPSLVYRVANMREKPHFVHYLLEEIRLESKGRLVLNPENTLVVSSTQHIVDQAREVGFTVDTGEFDETLTHANAPRPWDVIEELMSSGAQWRASAIVQAELHPECLDHYERYGLGDEIVEIFQDPLIESSDGDITTTRDYATYRQAFEDGAARKLADFVDYVQPGRILDVGCATGETIKLLSQRPELFESDFYGVEVARPLYQICQQRKSSGEFGDANVFFYQRNIMRSSLFPRGSLDTIITMALTHEIESYLGRSELKAFISRMYDITAPGGVYINYDVAAPNDKDKIVYALLEKNDGDNPVELFPGLSLEELPAFLRSLSTHSRFMRFMKDFRGVEGDRIEVKFETYDDQEYAVLRYADLCDFLAKKDYVNSWLSEMHERFCFWEYSDWVEAVKEVGFEVDPGSRPVQNSWLIENRFAPAAKVYERVKGEFKELDQPVTNILLVARKPLA